MENLTRKFVDKLKNEIGLTDAQVEVLKQKYCIRETELLDKVLYSYSISFKRGEDQSGKGIISKNEYEYLKREFKRNPKQTYCGREIAKYCNLNITFDELKFSDTIDDIDEFCCNNEIDEDIFDGWNLNSDNDTDE